tara:strand:+ start:81739 stop:82512 length:774 start_codon:yes stop_codon:yes gene_type:complete
MSINQHMILELDVGNSRIKWRLLAAEGLAVTGAGHVSGLEDLQRVTELETAITMARMCSVRGGDVNKQLADWVRGKYGVELVLAVVTQSCGGVTNQYADVSRLGIDRWLAMLAAFKRVGGACVVVDAGTAFTIDLLDAQGLHLGGYILPGLSLMGSSLESTTGIRLTPGFTGRPEVTGHSTDQAVSNGSLSALLALISQLMRAESSEQLGARLLFTGGDAELFHVHAAIKGSEIIPSLVLDGLDVACPHPDSDLGRN